MSRPSFREEVYRAIDKERDHQDLKWNADVHSTGDWIVFMRTYLTQAETRLSKESKTEGALEEIRKVVALGVACMEQNGIVNRKGVSAIVSKLRDVSGCGLVDCYRALEESGFNYDKALEILRAKNNAVVIKPFKLNPQ